MYELAVIGHFSASTGDILRIDWGTNGSWLSVRALILLFLGIGSFAFGLLKVIKQED